MARRGIACPVLARNLRSQLSQKQMLFSPHSGPTVVGDAFRMRTLDDLAQHLGQVLVVIRTVDAGGVLVGGAIGIAVGGAREPVGMGLIEVLGRSVGIHAGHHHQSVFVRSLRDFAIEIAAVQELRAVMQGEFAGVIGDDPACIDDDALHRGPFPVIPPPRNVVLDRILFGNVSLPPTKGAQVPGGRTGCSCLALSRERHGGSHRELQKGTARFGHGRART